MVGRVSGYGLRGAGLLFSIVREGPRDGECDVAVRAGCYLSYVERGADVGPFAGTFGGVLARLLEVGVRYNVPYIYTAGSHTDLSRALISALRRIGGWRAPDHREFALDLVRPDHENGLIVVGGWSIVPL